MFKIYLWLPSPKKLVGLNKDTSDGNRFIPLHVSRIALFQLYHTRHADFFAERPLLKTWIGNRIGTYQGRPVYRHSIWEWIWSLLCSSFA